LGFFKRKFPNTKFCATFHKPPEILKQAIPNPVILQQLDGAIAVGANQVEFLKKWLQIENVAYILHGVDTNFFVPDSSQKKQNTLLFVGQHLRNFDTFNKTVPKLAENIPDLKVNVVIHPAYKNKIKPHNSITVLTNIKDDALRELYQKATLLYLPLLDSTACNSILEAMACGLPIVTSRVGGNMAYLEGTSNVLIEPKNLERFVRETTALLNDKQGLIKKEKLSRQKAEELDWKNVANNISEFYKKLL